MSTKYQRRSDDVYYGVHDDYGAQVPATLFDPAQIQQTIDNAAKAAAQAATADLRRVHEVELKRMQEELGRSEEALKRAEQQLPNYQYNLCSSGYYSDRGAQHQSEINDSVVTGTSIAVDAAAIIYAAATVDAAAAAYFNAADDPEEQQRINDDITASYE